MEKINMLSLKVGYVRGSPSFFSNRRESTLGRGRGAGRAAVFFIPYRDWFGSSGPHTHELDSRRLEKK